MSRAKNDSIALRLTETETEALQRIGRRMARSRSDVIKMDGSVNLSATIRHLIREDTKRHGG